jgi:hypothetical protein
MEEKGLKNYYGGPIFSSAPYFLFSFKNQMAFLAADSSNSNVDDILHLPLNGYAGNNVGAETYAG